MGAWPGMHKFLFNLEKENKKLADNIRMEEVKILNYSVSLEHEYLPHLGVGWEGNHAP